MKHDNVNIARFPIIEAVSFPQVTIKGDVKRNIALTMASLYTFKKSPLVHEPSSSGIRQYSRTCHLV